MSILRKTMVSMALTLAFSGAAHALTIDPDGVGGLGTVDASVLDWTLGNAIVTPVDGTVQNPTAGDILQTYAHARLGTFNSGSQPVGGLFGNSEWTYVTGFQEVVSAVSGTATNGTATFQTIAGGDNFFQIWYSDTAGTVSSNLTGGGFNNGTLILSATVDPWLATDPTSTGQTTFTANTPLNPDGSPNVSPLDQFDGDDYPGILTVSGQGGGRIGLTVTSVDLAFFPGGVPSILLMDFDTQVNVPYDKTDPSACFWDGAAVIDGAGDQGTACLNSVGAINGVSGPNTMLMTDSSTSLVSVPEPMSLALMGLGLAGMGLVSRRRKA